MGSVVLSLDAELAWGFHDRRRPPLDRVTGARDGWRFALSTLEAHDIPATWAVVGHLFLSDCDGEHPGLPTPPGWFRAEREGELADRDLFCAPDLVGAIAESGPSHDLGVHTFSHVQFGAPDTTTALARAELEASVDVTEQAGFDPDSFVFPRNDIGHRDVLADSPFTCYRGVRPGGRGALGGKLGKLRAAAFGAGAPPLVEPRVDEFGLVDVPASLYLYGYQGLGRRLATTIRDDPVVEAVLEGLSAVAGTDRVLHLWLHPNNLVTRRDRERFATVCSLVADCRDGDAVSVETMRSVARRTIRDGSGQGHGSSPTTARTGSD